jgi:UDP-N-acetylmuramate dehydrogenase
VLKADLERALKGPVEERVPLSKRTSIRVGGPCALLATAQTEQGLADALDTCQQAGTSWHILGLGTNTLVADAGFAGVIFKLAPAVEEFAEEKAGHGSLKLGAGNGLGRLILRARERGLVGMESLGGIPGTIGGAVAMNAGTKSGYVERICAEIGVVEPGRARALRAEEIGFTYRATKLPESAVVTWARFVLPRGDAQALAASKKALDDDVAWRKRTQPYDLPSFGSTFKNPPGDFAGRLIEACGLKGRQQGGAQISQLHANFIVNRGEATCADVLSLMKAMFSEVKARFGVCLSPEVKLLGEFDAIDVPWCVAGAR